MGLRGGAVRSPVRVREKHQARAHRVQRACVGSKYHGQPQRRLRQEPWRAAHHATLNGWAATSLTVGGGEQEKGRTGVFWGAQGHISVTCACEVNLMGLPLSENGVFRVGEELLLLLLV